MIGDSTMAIKEIKAYPETGWGMPFVYFFDSSVTIENKAKNGRSTRTFVSEKLWQPVSEKMKEGDYLFIQFGHNDESKDKVDRYSSPEDFEKNLLMYVQAARNKKVIPVLITPVSRRNFDSEGNIKQTHLIYSEVVRKLAKEQNVILIDLDEKSRTLFQKLGDQYSKLLFMHLDSLEHPNYPAGRKDSTHFNELGALKIAELVLEEVKKQIPDLAERIVIRPVK
jgi:lysophospholipase L1-like esterase